MMMAVKYPITSQKISEPDESLRLVGYTADLEEVIERMPEQTFRPEPGVFLFHKDRATGHCQS